MFARLFYTQMRDFWAAPVVSVAGACISAAALVFFRDWHPATIVAAAAASTTLSLGAMALDALSETRHATKHCLKRAVL